MGRGRRAARRERREGAVTTMGRTNRVADYLVATLLGAIVFAFSPLGLLVTKGYAGLSLRAAVMTLALDAFLLAWIGAILTQGRRRRFFFHLTVWTFPLVLFDGLEEAARALHLAEKILPLTDDSVLRSKGNLPAYFFDESRSTPADPGWRLYRPHSGDGIFVNDLGLRTTAPTAKSPGEWRVAISGGSTVWGAHVLDADTISENLQRLLRRDGRKITVYNFGVEGATLEAELLTLKRFREIYALDEVLFYNGFNDVLKAYWEATAGRRDYLNFVSSSFELAKAARRANAILEGVNANYLTKFEREILPVALRNNPLRRGVAAAEDYCRAAELECVFAFQPMLITRGNHPAGEARLDKTYELFFPGMARLTQEMYRDALAAAPDGRIYDLTSVFDDQARPFFRDYVHVNEDGNRVVAETLVPALLKGVP
jgi:lysophospholipase L1-like esterase